MKACIDAVLAGHRCGALRILHENHGTYRGNRPVLNAFEDSLRRLMVTTPIVRVDDEHASLRRPLARKDRSRRAIQEIRGSLLERHLEVYSMHRNQFISELQESASVTKCTVTIATANENEC